MAKKPLTEWVSPTEFAKYKGITLSNVKSLIESGRLENCWKMANNKRKKINWRAADIAMKQAEIQADAEDEIENEQKVSQQLGVNNLTKARTAKTAMEAKAAQLKYEQLAGTLIKTDEVIVVAKEMGRLTKESLLTIPDRLAPLLAGMTDVEDISILLNKEINTALRNLTPEKYKMFKQEESDHVTS